MIQETCAPPVSSFKSLTAGSLSGASYVLVGHPLDTLKVRLQTMPSVSAGQPALYRGMFDCMRKTVSADGVTGLYKGMGSVLMGISPIYAICFFGYNWGRSICTSDPANPRKHEILFAGFFAGLFTTAIVTPVERVKCLLQVQSTAHSPKLYAGPVDAVWKLYRSGGLRSLYTGTAATMLRDIPGTGVYFLTYESIKDVLKSPDDSSSRLSLGRILLAGGIAGVLDWLVAIVPDFLKSRYQCGKVFYVFGWFLPPVLGLITSSVIPSFYHIRKFSVDDHSRAGVGQIRHFIGERCVTYDLQYKFLFSMLENHIIPVFKRDRRHLG